MPTLVVRGFPPELYHWLQREAQTHHRSTNRHTIALLEAIRERQRGSGPDVSDVQALLDQLHARLTVLHRKLGPDHEAVFLNIQDGVVRGSDGDQRKPWA